MGVGSQSELREVAADVKPFSAWIATVAIIVVELLAFALAVSSVAIRGGDVPTSGWKCRLESGAWVVSREDSQQANSVLRVGDQLVSIDGQRLGWAGPWLPLAPLRPGDSYTLIVERSHREIPLHLRMERDSSIAFLDVVATIIIAWLLFLAGLWMRIGGPGNLTARLGSAAFLLAGIAMIAPIFRVYPGWNTATIWLGLVLMKITRPWYMVLGWDFLSRFPHPVRETLTIRILRRCFYVAAGIFWLAANFPVFAEIIRLREIPLASSMGSLIAADSWAAVPWNIFDGCICVAVCYVLIRNYRLLADRDSRRRIRWAAVSFGVAAASLLTLRLLELVWNVTGGAMLQRASEYADAATTMSVGAIPITLTYAVVKHRLLGIRLVIRRGLQYLLARNVLRLIVFAPGLIVLIHIFRNPNESVYNLVFRSSWSFYLLVMGTAAFSLRYRRQLSRWLDRRFFRVALQEEEAWVALAESIKSATTEEEVAAAVAQQVEFALPVNGVHIFLRSGAHGRLRAAFSTPGRNAQKLCAQLENNHAALLAGNSVITVTGVDSDFAEPAHPEEDLLLVPLLGSDGQNLGAMLVGPKKSEQPFTRKERELLQAMAAQVVMACEVLRLKRNIDQESRQRIAVLSRLDRENFHLLSECHVCGSCYDASTKECAIDGTPLELTVPVERVVVGRYRLDRRIGAGGMGIVYQTLDLRLEKIVALKILLGELFGNREALLRFKREAQAVASLRHRNIVGVHDFGQLPAGGAFLVMDFVSGASWRQHLRINATLPPERVVNWVEGLCAGVAAAHQSGVVHRDLKPENVMISGAREVEAAMVLDFGLAKLHSGSEKDTVQLSVTGAVVGTRAYMSPEQRSGGKVGAAADVYSAAVMTLETLSRLSPPRAGATNDWIERALARVVNPGSTLPAIFRSALAESADVRIRSIEQFGSRLDAAIRSEVLTTPVFSGTDDAETLSLGAAS